ncbi:MAG TPA: TIGR03435 family protein [Bryobacteraceae bacterium]
MPHSAISTILMLGIATTTEAYAQPPAAAPRPEFEVASIKANRSGTTSMKFPPPANGRFIVTNLTLKTLITFAYGVLNSQISDAPEWTNSERFDIDARAAETGIGREQYQAMLQSLLADRFHLVVHREKRSLPVYELLQGKTAPHLKASDEQSCTSADSPREPDAIACGTFFTGPASLDARGMSMQQFGNTLAIVLGRPVADKTRISGHYDIHLDFNPEGVNTGIGNAGLSAEGDSSDTTRPSLFTALQQQLGLRLESHREPSDVLVIDRLERIPTEN